VFASCYTTKAAIVGGLCVKDWSLVAARLKPFPSGRISPFRLGLFCADGLFFLHWCGGLDLVE
jgi:hypothetical protein